VPVSKEERPCVRCGRMPTAKGADACLGDIKGVNGACCGHGVRKGFVNIDADYYKRRLRNRLAYWWRKWRGEHCEDG